MCGQREKRRGKVLEGTILGPHFGTQYPLPEPQSHPGFCILQLSHKCVGRIRWTRVCLNDTLQPTIWACRSGAGRQVPNKSVQPERELGDRFARVISLSDAAVTNSHKLTWLFPKVCSDSLTSMGPGSLPDHGLLATGL